MQGDQIWGIKKLQTEYLRIFFCYLLFNWKLNFLIHYMVFNFWYLCILLVFIWNTSSTSFIHQCTLLFGFDRILTIENKLSQVYIDASIEYLYLLITAEHTKCRVFSIKYLYRYIIYGMSYFFKIKKKNVKIYGSKFQTSKMYFSIINHFI